MVPERRVNRWFMSVTFVRQMRLVDMRYRMGRIALMRSEFARIGNYELTVVWVEFE